MAKLINTKTLTPFPCTACGLCCKNVHLSDITAYLDRGDSVCKFLNLNTNLCNIYETRPLVCRVDEFYLMHFEKQMDWDLFIEPNLEICKQLQQ